MKRLFSLLFCISLFAAQAVAQQTIQRPKLVVGVILDQMRWDYLYRYYDRYDAKGGFKRLLNQGFSCENTFIPYSPTVTACGHSSPYAGSVPAIHGIVGNNWWDKEKQKNVYCTEDDSVSTVGSSTSSGKQSPKNLLVTTICDELRLATNFKSKVIGIAIKDRGGILPAGHSANAAYWYDSKSGNWITSTYYMNDLPAWTKSFNDQKLTDKYYQQGWKLMYPANTYTQSTEDNKGYENKPFGNGFPYDLTKFVGKDFGKIASTPMGSTMTMEFSKAAINGEQLGTDNITDFITISFSTPDYIGHAFGPNSIEAEDGFLRIDKDLGSLLDFLDAKVGKNQYTLFLSADHGVAHIPEFLTEHKIPAGRLMADNEIIKLNTKLAEIYKVQNLIINFENYQLYFNDKAIDSANINRTEFTNRIMSHLYSLPEIDRVINLEKIMTTALPEPIRKSIINGFHPKRSGDIQIILKPGYIDGYSNTGTTHGLWNPYDSHIPLIWYGWGIKQGKTNRETYMTDVAATIAALLKIQMPSGSVGTVITEIMK